MRGSFPASHAVSSKSARALQGLEGETYASAFAPRSDAVPFLQSHGVDLSGSDSSRRSGFQLMRQLRRDASGERDALRGMRAEEEQTSTTSLIEPDGGL
jgi:hypothetical protein